MSVKFLSEAVFKVYLNKTVCTGFSNEKFKALSHFCSSKENFNFDNFAILQGGEQSVSALKW